MDTEEMAEIKRSKSPVPLLSTSMHGNETRITGSWIDNLTFAFGKNLVKSLALVPLLEGEDLEPLSLVLSRILSRIANASGKCLGSKSIDGEVTTKFAKRIFEFFCVAFLSVESCISFDGSVVFMVAVASGM